MQGYEVNWVNVAYVFGAIAALVVAMCFTASAWLDARDKIEQEKRDEDDG